MSSTEAGLLHFKNHLPFVDLTLILQDTHFLKVEDFVIKNISALRCLSIR